MTSPVIRSSEAISRAIDCTHFQAKPCSGCGEICVDVKRSFPKISADLDLFDQLSRDPGSFGGNHNIAKPSPGWDLNESIFTFIWSDLCQNLVFLTSYFPHSYLIRPNYVSSFTSGPNYQFPSEISIKTLEKRLHTKFHWDLFRTCWDICIWVVIFNPSWPTLVCQSTFVVLCRCVRRIYILLHRRPARCIPAYLTTPRLLWGDRQWHEHYRGSRWSTATTTDGRRDDWYEWGAAGGSAAAKQWAPRSGTPVNHEYEIGECSQEGAAG